MLKSLRCPNCLKGTCSLASEGPAICAVCKNEIPLKEGIYLADGLKHDDQETWQRKIYDARTERYEAEPLPTSDGLQSLLLTHREHVRRLDQLGINPESLVLDIGCSSGQILNLIAERYGAKGVGFDISIGALNAASHRNPHGHQYVLGSANRPLPFQDASFDFVVCFDVLEHLQKPRELAENIRRALKPGGKVLFHVPVTDFAGSCDWIYRKIKPDKWSKSMETAGHDYEVMLDRKGYEEALREAGLEVVYSHRFNSMFQNIFDYHLVHRILNRAFYKWNVPFSYYHRGVAPLIETALSADRVLQKFDIGASVYLIAQA